MRICSKCQQSSSLHDFVCSHCGAPLIDNGELLSALDLNSKPAKLKIMLTIGALIVVAIIGFLTKFLS
ncbi:hypothetical protein [Paenibacillus sp. IHBB 10380]|uniref:hypothetical protein n=1 Tax=Paenibacillus sp. IHBB 10380 TaxID=1566358 RepID=UPI0005CFCD9A|nr:hypothetical protein [Paenibacillus sp. IHBB 10380]AJS58159.1 hypothetical protein UB51_06210 [Paenibacillus sp. IHBB 10380]